MLENIKAALGITSSVFDDEISANILVALADMGCTTDITNLDDTDPLITQAVMTYCAYQHNLLHGIFVTGELHPCSGVLCWVDVHDDDIAEDVEHAVEILALTL